MLNEVVVTATRTERALDDLVADVTVLDRTQLDRMGAAAVGDALRQIPGVEITRNGGPGTTTNVYIRGAESRFTAVFIDGVRVDSQSTGGATWESIPLSQIDRIEVLRGPAGAVYGSDAMGGVIQLFTRQGEAGFYPYVTMGLATYGTSKLDAGLSGGNEQVTFAVSVGSEESRGFNARSASTVSPDDDGYHNATANGRLDLKLDARHRLSANWLMNDITSQYDAAASSSFSKLADFQNLRHLETGGLTWSAQWSDRFSTRLSVTDGTDRYETVPSPYVTFTRVRSYYLSNQWQWDDHQVSAALERREDALNNASTAPMETARADNGLALGYGWTHGAHAVQLNVRADQDSEFGAKQTGSISYGYRFRPDWRVTAATGTAFRAPTLFQRFSVYGTPTLEPETGTNSELGLQYAAGDTRVGAVVYQNKVTNLISFVSKTGTCAGNFAPTPSTSRGCYFNTAKASYYGVTFTGQTRIAGADVHASLDVQDPRDEITGNLLQRRAPHHATLGVDKALGDWTWGASVIASGDRYDNNTNTTVLKGYTLVNLSAEKPLGDAWKLLLRLDNATDAVYQLTDTYNSPGRSLFVGLKWEP